MEVSPMAVALWIVSVGLLAFTLVSEIMGYHLVNPITSIIFSLLFQEMSKFTAHIGADDGDNSHS